MAGLRANNLYGNIDFGGFHSRDRFIMAKGEAEGQAAEGLSRGLLNAGLILNQRREKKQARADKMADQKAENEEWDRRQKIEMDGRIELQQKQYALDVGTKAAEALKADVEARTLAGEQPDPGSVSLLGRLKAAGETMLPRIEKLRASVTPGDEYQTALEALRRDSMEYEARTAAAKNAKTPGEQRRHMGYAVAAKVRLDATKGVMESLGKKEEAQRKAQEDEAKAQMNVQARGELIPHLDAALASLPKEMRDAFGASFLRGTGDITEDFNSTVSRALSERKFEAGEDQRDKANEFRRQSLDLSRQRLDLAKRPKPGKEEKGLNGDAIGEAIDKELTIYRTDPDVLSEGLSDDEIREALQGRRLGPGSRIVLEGLAAKRGVTLVAPDPVADELRRQAVKAWHELPPEKQTPEEWERIKSEIKVR